MKTALLTDVHANREALTSCLEAARRAGARRFALLGDFVGYGADPAWVVDTIRSLVAEGAVAVLGNHDEAVAKGPRPTMIEDARRVVEWTRAQLDPGQLAFLDGLPLQVESDGLLFVHANAVRPAGWEYVSGRLEAVQTLQATRARVVFCGHVHDPHLYHVSSIGKAGEFVPVAGVDIPLLPNRQWLVIPGSVGQPRDGNPAACWAMFDPQAGSIAFHRTPYDVESAAAKVLAAGLPPELARRLHDGR